jgi:antitoxin (DNA-binding transcriptional repressor) of toxin-antitoxin stability system
MATAKKISATEAARSFSDVVSRVRYRGEEFIVEKGGEPVCRIGPVRSTDARSTLGDLAKVIRRLPPLDARYRGLVRTLARRQGKMPRSPWET